MIHPDEIKSLVKAAIPDAEVWVQDLTGGGDHFQISVVSSVFQGKMLIDQHRLIQQALQLPLEDGRIHAIQIKTKTSSDQTPKNSLADDFKILE